MKKLFYFGVVVLILFEIANVYFIMPMPGSQQMDSIGLAYFFYSWRWAFRILFAVMIVLGFLNAFRGSKISSVLFLLLAMFIVYMSNFKMAADSMFLQPGKLVMSPALQNKVDTNRLILGVEYKGVAKAYPMQFLGYHHQVLDSISGKPVIVTYCTVCRTGRVYEPLVNGKPEQFRLVGMDHFNAMFEDKTTKSWWRQVNGKAIAGKLKGQNLPEVASSQMTLGKWLSLYPNSLVMQPDENFKRQYTSMNTYETGGSQSHLTRKDSASWLDKSWVVGVTIGNESKAYDWNRLQQERIIYDELNKKPVVIVLANDNKSFVVLRRKDSDQKFEMAGDSIKDDQQSYDLLGKSGDATVASLEKINSYQEYWHSWRTFHPATKKY